MDQRVSVRRFIVPALLAGLTLCGTLGWSSSASARDPAAARVAMGTTHTAATARAMHPTVSSVPQRTATSGTGAGTTIPSKTVALHLSRSTTLKVRTTGQHGNFN